MTAGLAITQRDMADKCCTFVLSRLRCDGALATDGDGPSPTPLSSFTCLYCSTRFRTHVIPNFDYPILHFSRHPTSIPRWLLLNVLW